MKEEEKTDERKKDLDEVRLTRGGGSEGEVSGSTIMEKTFTVKVFHVRTGIDTVDGFILFFLLTMSSLKFL